LEKTFQVQLKNFHPNYNLLTLAQGIDCECFVFVLVTKFYFFRFLNEVNLPDSARTVLFGAQDYPKSQLQNMPKNLRHLELCNSVYEGEEMIAKFTENIKRGKYSRKKILEPIFIENRNCDGGSIAVLLEEDELR
jgi:hypothetical protein